MALQEQRRRNDVEATAGVRRAVVLLVTRLQHRQLERQRAVGREERALGALLEDAGTADGQQAGVKQRAAHGMRVPGHRGHGARLIAQLQLHAERLAAFDAQGHRSGEAQAQHRSTENCVWS